MFAFLLSCVLLTGCGAAGSGVDAAVPSPAAEAPAAGGKEAIPPEEANQVYAIVEKQVPAYICSLDEQLTEPYPLYFVNGVEDLPYVELREWAEILYFMNREYAGDTGYELTYFEQESGIVLERENGYSLEFDFINDRLIFDDYDAFIHNSSDTTLIDLLSESGFDENGEAELFQRDTRASFDRNGDLMTVELGSYGIRMIAQDGKYYVPLQTMNDFLISPMKTSFLYNGEALILANDEDLFDYEKGEYTELAGFYYEAEPRQRSDELAAYSYNELCLVMDTFYGLKEPHEIRSFRQLFWEIAFDEPLSGNDPAEADRALKAFIDYYLDDLLLVLIVALSTKRHNMRQSLIVSRPILLLISIGKEFLMMVFEEFERILYDLNMSSLLFAFFSHHPSQRLVPLLCLLHLLFVIAKAREIISGNAVGIESVGTNQVLHLIHIYKVGADALAS